jgi:hypothetical protein
MPKSLSVQLGTAACETRSWLDCHIEFFVWTGGVAAREKVARLMAMLTGNLILGGQKPRDERSKNSVAC